MARAPQATAPGGCGGRVTLAGMSGAAIATSASKRPLGPRALLTRQRLLEGTAALLNDGGVRDFKVVDVARAVGVSAATFYEYFPTVDEALLELARRVTDEQSKLLPMAEQEWESLDQAREFVADYVHHFDRNRAVLRYRNLAAQEGDQRFREVRNEAHAPLTRALAAQITVAQQHGRVDLEIHPYAAAGGMVAMVERLAEFQYEFGLRGVSEPALIETAARTVFQIVTGRS